MEIRRALAAALVAGVMTTGVSSGAWAKKYVEVYVAPPPPHVEIVPPPRVGYVWVPGNWYWTGHEHRWHRGHWVRERHGYAYVPPRWHQHGDRWRYDDGHWQRRG